MAENDTPQDQQEKKPDQKTKASIKSLRQFLQKRKQKRLMAGADTGRSNDNLNQKTYNTSNFKPFYHSPYAALFKDTGLTINHMDTQLAKGHLEKYLPTPSTRYHMMKERVQDELKLVEKELDHCKQFEGREYRTKIDALEIRFAILKKKISLLDEKIAEHNPFQTLYKQLVNISINPLKEQAKKWTWFPNSDLRTEVSSIKDIMAFLEENIHTHSFSPEQLGRLINDYDKHLKNVAEITNNIDKKKTLRDKLNDKVTDVYRFLYVPKELEE